MTLGTKLLILTVCVLVSIIVAIATAFLAYDADHVQDTLLAAGAAFGSCLLLFLAVTAFLLRGEPRP